MPYDPARLPGRQINGMEPEAAMSETLLPFPWFDLVLILALVALNGLLSMSELAIDVATAKASMAEVRPALERALRDRLPADLLRHRWEGDVLRLTGPGAEGSVVYDRGRLRLRATLHFPASLLRSAIADRVRTLLEEAAGRIPA